MSVYKVGKQFPLEMGKDLGNLYNKLERLGETWTGEKRPGEAR